MPLGLISAKQLSPDVSGIVGQYGSGYFLSNQNTGHFLTSGNIYDNINITGVSGISARTGIINSDIGIIIAYTGEQINESNYVHTFGDENIQGIKTFNSELNILNNANISGVLMVGGSAEITNTLLISGSRAITTADTGLFYDRRNPDGYVTNNAFLEFSSQTGCFVTQQMTGSLLSGLQISGVVTSGSLSGTLNKYTENNIFYSGISGVAQLAIGYSKLKSSNHKLNLFSPTGTYNDGSGNIGITGGRILMDASTLSGMNAYFQPIQIEIGGQQKTIIVLCTDPF